MRRRENNCEAINYFSNYNLSVKRLSNIGYAVSHADDVYKLLNPNSKHFIEPGDVIWLERSNGDRQKSKVNSHFKDDDSDNETGNFKNISEKEKASVEALRETSKLKS